MPKLFVVSSVITLILISLVGLSPTAGAIADTDPTATAETTLPDATSEAPADTGLPVPGPDPNDVMGDIMLDPTTGMGTLSPEVLDQLNSALQPEKSAEDLRREQWIRIAIDVAIGVGAALIFLSIWWLVKLKRKKED
jgi:hypothetical protein